MADTDFYNLNLHRAYPMVDPGDGSLDSLWPYIVDVGFIFLPPSDVSSGTPVYLTNIKFNQSSQMWEYLFEVDGKPDLDIKFSISPTNVRYSTYWTSVRLNGVERRHYGSSFLAIGEGLHPQRVASSSSSIPVPVESSSSSAITRPKWRVEPALVQTLKDHYITSVTFANSSRTCSPDPCSFQETDQLGFGSSSSAANTLVRELAPRADGMNRALSFKEGYNCSIVMSTSNNSIRFGGEVGAGDGEVCEEIARTAEEETKLANNETLDNATRCGDVLYTINDIQPDENGHFRLTTYHGMNISAQNNCLTITVRDDLDDCS